MQPKPTEKGKRHERSKNFQQGRVETAHRSEHWYSHGINRKILFTDSAKYVADTVGAYWLLDEIAIIQPYDKQIAAARFQL